MTEMGQSSITNLSDPSPKIVVLTLERAQDRQARIARLLEEASITYDFFKGTDGAGTNNPIVKLYDEKLRIRTKGQSLSPGQLGCFASHYRIWQQCVSERRSYLVLEDDVTFDPLLLKEFLASAHEFPEEAGCIRLFDNKTRNHEAIPILSVGSFTLMRYTKGPMSTMGYYLTPGAAKKFLAQTSPVFLPVDIFMDRYWHNNVQCCGISPGFVFHDYGFKSMIGYSKRLKRRPLSERLFRELFSLKEHWKRYRYNQQFKCKN